MNTVLTVAPIRTPRSRFRQALSDAWTIARRDLAHWVLQPGVVILGWIFPVMIFLMFGFLFGGAIGAAGDGSYIDFLMPGMFAMTMFFGLEATVTAVANDAAKGVTDRFRTLPIFGAAVVVGRCLADMLNSVVGLLVMVITGFALGWRWHGSLAAACAAFGLLLLLRFALLWVGIALGLSLNRPEGVTVVQILVWPLGFLSNIFVNPATMPGWLAVIASWNPLSATVSATRELFLNPGWGGDSWIAIHAFPMAVAWPLLITAVFFPVAVRQYRRLGR